MPRPPDQSARAVEADEGQLSLMKQDMMQLRNEVYMFCNRISDRVAALERLGCSQELAVNWAPGPIGIKLNDNIGVVEEVYDGGQAQSTGVMAGMYFATIDDQFYTPALLDQSINGEQSYKVVFQLRKDPATEVSALANGQTSNGNGLEVSGQSSTTTAKSSPAKGAKWDALREKHAEQDSNFEAINAICNRHAEHIENIKVSQDKHIEVIASDVAVLAKKAGVSKDELQMWKALEAMKGQPSSQSAMTQLRNVVSELVQSALEEAVSYQLQETVWDAAILIGMPLSLGIFDSGILAFAVVMQATLQSLLCVIVIDLSNKNTSTLQNAGISVDCHERLGEFDTFMNDGLGPMLSCLMIMTWTMCSLKEFRHIADFMMAVWSLPRAQRTSLNVHERSGRIMIQTISYGRLVMVNLSAGLQFGIAATLLILGSMWLASTVNVEALLLNGVALQFIMEIDELVYFVFCSAKIKTITTSLHPLRLPKRIVLPGSVSIRALASLFTWVGFLVIMAGAYLRPNFDTMNDLISRQCTVGSDDTLGG